MGMGLAKVQVSLFSLLMTTVNKSQSFGSAAKNRPQEWGCHIMVGEKWELKKNPAPAPPRQNLGLHDVKSACAL